MTGDAVRMSPCLAAAVITWCAVSVAAAPVLGRAIRGAREAERPNTGPPARPLPADAEGWQGGALLRLAQATDPDTARKWVAEYGRHGATPDEQRQAWDEWTRMRAESVTYLHTYRKDHDQ